jgi:hypothetical protein
MLSRRASMIVALSLSLQVHFLAGIFLVFSLYKDDLRTAFTVAENYLD